MPNHPDLIFVSMENWDDIWRRNQFVCAELARRHPLSKILFVGLARDISNRLRHGNFAELKQSTTYGIPAIPNITITHPLKFFPNSIPFTRRLNERMFRRHVRRAARSLGITRPVLWLNPHSANHMAGRMDESAVIYDITDDWTSLTQSPKLKRLVEFQDADLCRRADQVIVCSQRLHNLKSGLCSNLHLIPNGVDAEHYRSAYESTAAPPAPADRWPKPVFGYTGTIHPDRVDVNLIESFARNLTTGSIALIGPNHLREADMARLNLPNVFFTDAVPYQQIPHYMRAFDVCIAPHLVTPFTESLNPIKLWEYLAVGKPIVSTPIAGFRDYPQLVYLASTPAEFSAMMQQSLFEDPGKPPARRREALRHSWSTRVDEIESVMCTGAPERHGATAHAR
jgi:teichuronic acid biosynthesis glycosyltransferase TuaH